jgi:hypothetical protein
LCRGLTAHQLHLIARTIRQLGQQPKVGASFAAESTGGAVTLMRNSSPSGSPISFFAAEFTDSKHRRARRGDSSDARTPLKPQQNEFSLRVGRDEKWFTDASDVSTAVSLAPRRGGKEQGKTARNEVFSLPGPLLSFVGRREINHTLSDGALRFIVRRFSDLVFGLCSTLARSSPRSWGSVGFAFALFGWRQGHDAAVRQDRDDRGLLLP